MGLHSDFELSVTNPDGSRSSIKQEEVASSKKTLGIYDAPSGGNQGHLEYIHGKLRTWITRMKNGHLPAHMAWTAYNRGRNSTQDSSPIRIVAI
jgi:hypothetical protein